MNGKQRWLAGGVAVFITVFIVFAWGEDLK